MSETVGSEVEEKGISGDSRLSPPESHQKWDRCVCLRAVNRKHRAQSVPYLAKKLLTASHKASSTPTSLPSTVIHP